MNLQFSHQGKGVRLFSIWCLGMSLEWSIGNLVSWKDKFCLQTVSAKDESSKYCSGIRLLSGGKTPSLWMQFVEMKDFACGVSLKYSRFLKRRGQIFSHLWMKVNGSKESERKMWKRNYTGKSRTAAPRTERWSIYSFKPNTLFTLCWRSKTWLYLSVLSLSLSDVSLKNSV